MDLLTVARQCHNDDPWNDDSLTPFFLTSPQQQEGGLQIGFLQPIVLEQIQKDHNEGRSEALSVFPHQSRLAVCIHSSFASNEQRSKALKGIVEDWRDRGLFPDPLQGWRNELYSIYGPSNGVEALKLERASCALFGVATFGVHATAYTSDYRIWVPRRARTKATFPGMLDNSAAGGISAGDSPFESMVRECGEEAGLEESVVRKAMRQTGVISYFYRSKAGWIQPEVEYTYDLLLDESVSLHPVDGEAEEFRLMDKEEVIRRMRQGEFKPNCAMVLIDFFIRHGLITVEECDCDFTTLVSSLHNDMRLPGP